MSDDASNSPEPNPSQGDQAELEYLSLVDDLDDQFITDIDHPINTQKIEPQGFLPKPVMVLPQRLMLWAIACATIPTCIVSGFAYQVNLRANQERAIRVQEIRTVFIADRINRIVLGHYQDSKNLSLNLARTSGLQANRTPSDRQKLLITSRLNSLNTYNDRSKIFDSVAIYNLRGNLIVQTIPKRSPQNLDRDILKKAVKFNSPLVIQPVSLNKAKNEYAVQFIIPILDRRTQRIQAILKTVMPINTIQTNLRNSDYDYIISKGENLLITTPTNSENKYLKSIPTPTIAGLPDLNWNIAVSLNLDYDYSFAIILGINILVLIVAIALISYIAARRLSHRLIQATNTIGSYEKRLAVNGNDEIDQLSSNINLMNSKFQSLLVSEKRTIEQLQRLIAKGVSALQKVIKSNGEDTSNGDLEAIAAHLQASLVKKQTEINLLNREQERLQQQLSQLISQQETEVKTFIQSETREVMGNLETGTTQISEATKLISALQADLLKAEELIKQKADVDLQIQASLQLLPKVSS